MKNGLITLDLIHFIREYRNRLCCGRAPAAGVLASFALDKHYLLCGSHGYRGAPPLGHLLCHGIKTYLLKEVPGEYLLPSQSGGPMTEAGILWVVKRVAKSEGITNDIHIQTLRHSYATHLLERGVNILVIKELLGCQSIETTIVYLHVAQPMPCNVFSPLDTLYGQL